MTKFLLIKDKFVTEGEIEFVTNVIKGEFKIIDILDSKTYDKLKNSGNFNRKIIMLSLGNDYDLNKEILELHNNSHGLLLDDEYDKYVVKVYRRLFNLGYGLRNTLCIGLKNGAELFTLLGNQSVLRDLVPYSNTNDIEINIGTINSSFSEIVNFNASFLPVSDKRSIAKGADKLEIIGWGANFNFQSYTDSNGEDYLKKLDDKFVEPFIYYTRGNNNINFLIDIESSFSSEFIEYFKYILNNKPFKN